MITKDTLQQEAFEIFFQLAVNDDQYWLPVNWEELSYTEQQWALDQAEAKLLRGDVDLIN